MPDPGAAEQLTGEGVARLLGDHRAQRLERLREGASRSAWSARRSRLKVAIRSLGSFPAATCGPGRALAARAQVAERAELLRRLGVDAPGAHGPGGARGQALQLGAQEAGHARLVVDAVLRLARVAGEVVELRARSVDELVALVAQGAERRAVQVELRDPGLGVDRGDAIGLPPVDRAPEAARMRRRERRPLHEVEDRRSDVDRAHGLGHHLPRGQEARPPEDQGDADGALVHEHRVRLLAVVAEALPVVADHGDESALLEAERAQPVEDLPQSGVGERDLAVVGTSAKASRNGDGGQ